MPETLRPIPEYDIPTVLRRLEAKDVSKLNLSIDMEHYPTSQGLLRTYHVTTVRAIDSLDSKLGRFYLSLAFMRPQAQTDSFDPPLEPGDREYPDYPFYRIRVSKVIDKEKNSVEFVVDDAFKIKVRDTYERLVKKIYEKEKSERESSIDAISYVLREYEH